MSNTTSNKEGQRADEAQERGTGTQLECNEQYHWANLFGLLTAEERDRSSENKIQSS